MKKRKKGTSGLGEGGGGGGGRNGLQHTVLYIYIRIYKFLLYLLTLYYVNLCINDPNTGTSYASL